MDGSSKQINLSSFQTGIYDIPIRLKASVIHKRFISEFQIFITICACICTMNGASAQGRFFKTPSSDRSQALFNISTELKTPSKLSQEQISSIAASQANFTNQIIIQTGEYIDDSKSVIALGTGPSINNYGKIAFTALRESDDARTVCLYDRGHFIRKYYTPAHLPGFTVQVNDLDHIAYWAQNYINPDLDSYIFRLDTENSGPMIASGNPWVDRWVTDFQSLTSFVSIANNDRVIFGGDLRKGGTVLASRTSGSDQYMMSDKLSNYPTFYPKISDNNRTIIRGGANETAPIVLFLDETLNIENAISLATNPEFTRIGDKPGISDDGQITVFTGEHSMEGAAIYVTTVNDQAEAIQFQLTSLPGELVNLNHWVAVNSSGSGADYEYLIAYLAYDEQGIFTLFAATIDVSNPYSPVIKSTSVIAKVGETIAGLEGRINNLSIYDPVNNLGDIVFWVQTETNRQAIVKASHIPIAFIDDYPDYATDDNKDSDNYFLRQDNDFEGIDIYYKISEGLAIENVKINIYPEMGTESLSSLEGEKVGSSYKTGDNLHVAWTNVKEKDKFRDFGFYRLELEVLLVGETIPIKTSIEDADPEMPGWQCPQDGVGIHDLVYKHRPYIYTGNNEKVTPNGPIHPFTNQILPFYKLQEAKRNLNEDLVIDNATKYNEFEDISETESFNYREFLNIKPSDPSSILFIDIEREKLESISFTESYLFHRGHPDKHNNYLFIHYWMYHPSSHSPYGPVINNEFWHEGDWEMVQLCIQKNDSHRKSNKDNWFLPFAATASQHYYGQTLAWRLDKQDFGSLRSEQRFVQTWEEGNRVIVYVAENSHACYFRNGTIKVPPKVAAGCGIQHQYEHDNIIFKDVISGPLGKAEYKLQALEDKDGIGIYNWPGMWGEYETKHQILLKYGIYYWPVMWGEYVTEHQILLTTTTAHSPRSPGFRISRDERGGPFLINSSPVVFHNLCRKNVDNDGNFKVNGDPDPLTELVVNSSEKKSAPIASLPVRDQISSQNNEFLWAQQAEEAVAILGTSVATDKDDNIVVAGINIYDSNLGSKELSGSENAQSFLAKYDSTGVLLWTIQIIGSEDVYGLDIATDREGAVYITGGFTDTLQIGTNTLVSKGFSDIFILKIDSEGDIVWANQGNSPSDNLTGGIAINNAGELIIVGSFRNNLRFGDITLTSMGGSDLFMAKYGNDGELVWAKSEGGSGDDYGLGVAFDNDGNIGITGYFEGSAFFSGNELISAGKSDMFIASYAGDGALKWINQGGGSGDDFGGDVVVDKEGNVNVTGAFVDTASFDFRNIISEGEQDMVIAQYSSSGNLNWVNSIGGINSETRFEIETNLNNDIIIAGNFSDTVSIGDTLITSLSSGTDFSIIGHFDQQGNFLEVSQISGSGNLIINDLSVDSNNSILTTGSFTREIDFGNITLNSTAYYGDIFTAKIKGRNALTPSGERVKIFSNRTHILSQVYPNPFQDDARLALTVFQTQRVQISIYNETGQKISQIYDGILSAGNEKVFEVGGKEWIPGQFICVVKGEKFSESRKLVIIK